MDKSCIVLGEEYPYGQWTSWSSSYYSWGICSATFLRSPDKCGNEVVGILQTKDGQFYVHPEGSVKLHKRLADKGPGFLAELEPYPTLEAAVAACRMIYG